MATVITGVDGQHTYTEILRHVLKNGRPRSPRDVSTLDAGFTVIELASPHRALPLGVGRSLNQNIAAAEAVQLIGGFSSPDLLTKAAPLFTHYAEPEGNFHGAYGSRIGYQVLNAVTKLRADPETRRAVITLWDPWLDNLESKRDYPCTVMLQFELAVASPAVTGVGDQLNMNVVMRSNDVWLGLPYDLFQFTQLQLSVTNALGVDPGWYRHTVMSLHIYERNVADAEKIQHNQPTDFRLQPRGIGRFGEDAFTSIMKRARILTARVPLAGETPSEVWYRERFASYLG